MMKAPYPWQETLTQTWGGRVLKHELQPALLITGMKGIGKQAWGMALAEHLLCASDPKAQHWFSVGTHPDFHLIKPNEKGLIPVEAIRSLSNTLYTTASAAQGRVVLMQDAHRMNLASANALLKILEEPPLGVLFILITDKSAHLPATILSRLLKVPHGLPAAEVALAWLSEQGIEQAALWLRLAQGAPLQAQHLAQEEATEPQLDRCLQDILDLALHKKTPSMVSRDWLHYPERAMHYWMHWLGDMAYIVTGLPNRCRLQSSPLTQWFENQVQPSHAFAFHALKQAQNTHDAWIRKPGYNLGLALEAQLSDWQQQWL